MFDKGLVSDVADLYSLEKEQLLTLAAMKDKQQKYFLQAIDASRGKFLLNSLTFGLGICSALVRKQQEYLPEGNLKLLVRLAKRKLLV